MTHEGAITWLEASGIHVRTFGRQIVGCAGEPVCSGVDDVKVYPAIASLDPPDAEGKWVIWDHGVLVGRFEDFASAVAALRDHLVSKLEEP